MRGGGSNWVLRLPQGHVLPDENPLLMGVLNMTPDSFSDGGLWVDPGAACAHAWEMAEAGARIIDIGGESTRPGSSRVTPEQEWERIGAVVPAVVDAGLVVSVDTVHAETARRAIDAGASIINDVSGGRIDPQMNSVVAGSDVAYVIQHYRALPGQPGEHFDYGVDLIATLISRLQGQIDDALEAGVAFERIIVDPGLGFSLLPEQCWQIINNLARFHELSRPILVGASRKRFLAYPPECAAEASTKQKTQQPVPQTQAEKDAVTAQITATVAQQGAWAVRVHNIEANKAALG